MPDPQNPDHQPAQTMAQHQQAQESPGEAVQGSPTISAATAGGEAVPASPEAPSPSAPAVQDQDEPIEHAPGQGQTGLPLSADEQQVVEENARNADPVTEEGAQDARAIAKASGQGTLDPDLPIKRQIEEGRASQTAPGSTEQGASSDVVTSGAAGVFGAESGNKNG